MEALGEHCPLCPFKRGAMGAEVRFHNSNIGNFMVYQDRLEINLLQLFRHPEISEWFSVISVIIFEVNIVDEQKKNACEQKYEQFVQLCTDKEGSASDMCSVASKRSSASFIDGKHEMIALQWKQTELSLELERAQAEAERSRADAEFRWRKFEVEMEKTQAVAQMELLKLKEAMSTSASSRSKRKKQLQQRAVAANHSEGEPCCSKDVTKDFLSFPLGNAVSTRAATTTSRCVFSPVVCLRGGERGTCLGPPFLGAPLEVLRV